MREGRREEMTDAATFRSTEPRKTSGYGPVSSSIETVSEAITDYAHSSVTPDSKSTP